MLTALSVIINNLYYDGLLQSSFMYDVSKANQNSVFINQFYSLFSILMSGMCIYIYTCMCTPTAWCM